MRVTLNTETELGRRAVEALQLTGLPIKVLRDETTENMSIIVIEYWDSHLSDGQRVLVELVEAYDRAVRWVDADTLARVMGP